MNASGPEAVAKLISIAKAAEIAGVSRSMAYTWSKSGHLPGLVEINSRLYVRRAIFEAWLLGTELRFDKENVPEALRGTSVEAGYGPRGPST